MNVVLPLPVPKSAPTAPELRVALFSGNYNYVRDGANQALNKLVDYLERQGIAVRVYSPTTAFPAFEPSGTLISVPAWRIPLRPDYRYAKPLGAETRRDLEAFAPTLVHLAAPDSLGFSVKKWAKHAGVPVVSSVHTRFETYFAFYGLAFLRRWAERHLRRFYHDLDEIYATSEGFAEVLLAQGMSDRIKVWSRGIDKTRFTPTRRDLVWRRGLGIGIEEPTIAFVGRLVPEKGLDVVAATMAELTRRGVPHRLMVVGDGPARAKFQAQVPEAVLTGFLGGLALPRAYASADMMLNPSTTETFGNVTLEAMASGLPVIAADATGNTCLVVDGVTGALVPPGDATAFADAIQALVENPAKRAAVGQAGLARAATYDWDAINATLLGHYRAVVAKHARSPILAESA
ncbi:glycosyltransferase family 1 protein [Sphingosinicellaceae bacterium]|nr:glycosyltransferase family 1 protein [Sphingosinicellaceae bacterium]